MTAPAESRDAPPGVTQRSGSAFRVRSVWTPWLVGALLALLWVPAQATQVRFAVVIGANRGEPGEVGLLYAEQDAARFADVLTRLGGVAEENMVLLKGRSADRVQAALVGLAPRVAAHRAAGDDTAIFVYYSGHADAEALHLGGSRFPLTQLEAGLQAVGAHVAVLVVDACRSGALTRVKGAAPAEPFDIRADDRLEGEGTAVIASSALGEDAQESDHLGGGVFSHHFIAGLLGAADQSGDRQVTLPEAYRYAYQETLRTTSQARFVQHPTYDFRLRGREDLVITRLEEAGGLGRVHLPRAGAWLLLPQGQGELVELSAEANTEILVVPGRYIFRLRTDDGLFEGTAAVPAGTRLALDTDTLTPVPYGVTVRKGLSADRRLAWGPMAGLEVAGPTRPELSPTLSGTAGVRLDLEPLSLEVRLLYQRASATNAALELTQDGLGLDATALRLVDFGALAAGLGVRLGVDGVRQRFETRGEAPDRLGLVGRGGALARLEYAPWAGVSLTASAGLDGLILRKGDGTTGLDAVPFGGLGVTLYVP